MRNIAVFFGGRSNEREISIITGMLAVNLLRGEERYRVFPMLLGDGGEFFLCKEARGVADFREDEKNNFLPVRLMQGGFVKLKGRKKFFPVDCALNCCHGGMGEDGTLSALLKWSKIPLCSPDTPLSAMAMNKEYSQVMAQGLGIPTVQSFALSEGEWLKNQEDALEKAEAFGFPVIVKPSTLGSSIGIHVARERAQLLSALNLAFQLDTGVVIERYLEGKRDLNCAVVKIGDTLRVSPVEEVFSNREILTFAEKYEGEGERVSQIPASIPQEVAQRVSEYTATLYTAFHGRGIVRADFLFADGKVYFNELNTVPGSLACYLFGESLSEAKDLLCAVVEDAIAKFPPKKRTVSSGILSRDIFCVGKGCKRR